MSEELVSRVLRLAGDLVVVHALSAAWAARRAGPARWLVVGRQGVGKSRLINDLLGCEAPVGLGGVTAQAESYASDGLELVDTPALESEFDGLDLIQAHLGEVDGLLWVVDGLQPLTSLERRIVDRAVPHEAAVVAVVSRLDLVEAGERASVLGRVAHLLGARAPAVVVAGLDVPAVQLALAEPRWRASPRRMSRMRAAVAQVLEALSHLVQPDAVTAESVVDQARARWRGEIKAAHDVAADRVRDGSMVFRDAALSALHKDLIQSADRVRGFIESELGTAPVWRPAAPGALDVWGQAKDLVAGTPGVLRGLREGAAMWASEGELAWQLTMDRPEVISERRRLDAVTQAIDSVAELHAALPTWSLPD